MSLMCNSASHRLIAALAGITVFSKPNRSESSHGNPLPHEPAQDPWPYPSKPAPVGMGMDICGYRYGSGKKTPG
jgi:hypothetical protein